MTKAYLSKRALADLRQVDPLRESFAEMQRNPYSKNDNGEGLISLGVAENKLMQEELLQKLPSLFELDYAHLQYGFAQGSVELRTHVAKLLNKYFDPKTPVHPEHITVTNGAGSAINALSYTICDPGDAVLITAPYYGAFDSDVSVKSGARTITVNLEGRSPFDVDHVESLESAYQKAVADGINVRAMIISNPHNPLARCYSRAVIERLLRFASKHSLHAIFDEIYALSGFEHIIGETRSDPFMSVLSLDNLSSLIDPALVHVVYAISKDFCLNGFRVGFHISPFNQDVVAAMKKIADFTWVSSATEALITNMLSDDTWVDWFLTTNQRRLAESYERLTHFLRSHSINYLPAQAGHFIFIDLRSFLPKPPTSNGPVPDGARQAERALARSFIDHGVYIAAGEAFHSEEEGWFRLTFATDWEMLQLGLKRMMTALSKVNPLAVAAARKSAEEEEEEASV